MNPDRQIMEVERMAQMASDGLMSRDIPPPEEGFCKVVMCKSILTDYNRSPLRGICIECYERFEEGEKPGSTIE